MKRWVWWVIGIVVVLVVLVVVADFGFRAYAQGRAETEIANQLPENVEGDVDVTIGGFSFLGQLVAGEFDEVHLVAPALTVSGVPITADVVATGVPTDLAKPVGEIVAQVSLDQAAVNSVIELPGDAQLALGDGDVSYDGSVSFLGIDLGYSVTGLVTASGTDVVITPQSAELTQGDKNLDLSGVLQGALDGLTDEPISVCVAEYLPVNASIDSLDIAPEQATATLRATDFVLSEDSLQNLGSCP